MNTRIFAVLILIFALIVSLSNVAQIGDWSLMDAWTMVNVGVNLLSASAIVLVAFWVYEDDAKSKIDEGEYGYLDERLSKIERYVDEKTRARRPAKARKEWNGT